MFLRGKRMLLRYIPRNQNKTVTGREEHSQGKEEHGYMARLAQEIASIQRQQMGLESLMAELGHQNEASDLSTQSMMSRFYSK